MGCSHDGPCACELQTAALRDALRRLARALCAVDVVLPHNAPRREDAPPPPWCDTLRAALEYPDGECCGVCEDLSEVTVTALDEAFR